MLNKDELRKCLKGLNVEEDSAEKFVCSLSEIYTQLLDNDIRTTHPSLLKMRYVIEEMLAEFESGSSKILASSTYSSPSNQAFVDLNDALVIQIAKARQFLKKD